MAANGNTFACAIRAELEALHRAGEPREFAAGQVIFTAGDPGDGVYVVDSGQVQIVAPFAGSEPRVLATISAGDFFGEMAILDDAPRSATARAETATRATFVSRAELLNLLDRQPRLALNLIREFSGRIRALNHKYVDEIIQSERLALIGRFAATIVHDFKNPLTIIGLAAELTGAESTPPAVRAKAGEKIHRQIERMTNMLQELIDFSRPSGSRVALRETNFARFLSPLIDEVRAELVTRNVAVEMTVAPPDATVRIDPPRLSRLFYNLLNNAAEAMPEGGRILLRFTVRATELQIDVEDTGAGIAPEIATTLFQPFATHGKKNGTGLGLTICKKIAEDHGGRIWVESPPGRGATFSFTLPLAS
ncbi:ATP-binding protein [Opitutus sp. ER46]|uniref:ATP-binding protein n=1 Tax=Opitutus sp. ER46 TaxID=2161864 RepID=UPI001304F105|nr:ATP-binding protein [Opitutus sp. ER46]